MIGTFIYLTFALVPEPGCPALRRLREPRYVAGLLVGLAYSYFAVLRNQLRAARQGRKPLR